MSLRDLVPFLMLRLDRGQECYDLIKWWCTVGSQSAYDWEDMDGPYLDLRGADALEYVEPFEKPGHMGQTEALLLLKIKLIIDIRNIKLTRRVLTGRLPTELWRKH